MILRNISKKTGKQAMTDNKKILQNDANDLEIGDEFLWGCFGRKNIVPTDEKKSSLTKGVEISINQHEEIVAKHTFLTKKLKKTKIN